MKKKDFSKFTGLQREILELSNAPEAQTTKVENERYNKLCKLQWLREAEIREAIPKPTCCQAAHEYPSIYFRGRSNSIFDGSEVPASWYVSIDEFWARSKALDELWWKKRPTPKFCSYCGTELPLMKKDPKVLCRPEIDDGNHCKLCSERLSNCMCLPPQAAYRPVTK